MNAIERIISHFGSKAALARALEVKPQNITRWSKQGVPAAAAIQIEKITKGKFKAIDIPLYSSVG